MPRKATALKPLCRAGRVQKEGVFQHNQPGLLLLLLLEDFPLIFCAAAATTDTSPSYVMKQTAGAR